MSTSVLPSEEVAEDYKSSLEDLTFNSRWEISNLTVIAKENIHAAQAIARVLEEHIGKTAPAKKLPALYLLDSIVKNVGTPYTLFFGRNLYQTFMNAYTLVDQPIRKKLEEMLHTWKQPVPGSPSTAPVFPLEITKKIEAALIKARIATLQLQKEQQVRQNLARAPGTTPIQQFRTPTPQAPPASNGYPNGYEYGRDGPGVYNRQTSVNMAGGQQNLFNSMPLPILGQPGGYPSPAPGPNNVEVLLHEISNLIVAAKNRFVENPLSEEAQKKLKALLDLQKIIQTQQLPQEQLALVKEQLAVLAKPPPPPPQPVIPPSQPTAIPLQIGTASLAALLSSSGLTQFTQPPTQPVPATTMASLATLLAAPPILPQAPPPRPPPPPAPAISDASSLIASLQTAGLLPSVAKNPTSYSLSVPQSSSQIPGLIPPVNPITPVVTPPTPVSNTDLLLVNLELNSTSLKIPRTNLISLLYDALPNMCSTCARRFPDTQQGKEDKANHLDWHFRVNQRLQDSLRRGHSRSWYVGEMDWIKSKDDLEDTAPQARVGTTAGTTGTVNTVTTASGETTSTTSFKDQYVPVPSDPSLANLPCPICKEKFQTVWHPEAEEWVWMDATEIGNKIYHASCSSHNKIAPAAASIGRISRGATPDISVNDLAAILKSVPKRKFEESTVSEYPFSTQQPPTKLKVIKKEPVS